MAKASENVYHYRLPWWLSGTESTCQCRRQGLYPWSRKIPHAAEQPSAPHCAPQLLGLCSRAWVKVKVKVTQLCPTLCDPIDYTVHGILQAKILEWVVIPFSRGLSQPRDWTQNLHSLPTEPPGNPKNTGVGSLSLLQRIFLTQELNLGLLALRSRFIALHMTSDTQMIPPLWQKAKN